MRTVAPGQSNALSLRKKVSKGDRLLKGGSRLHGIFTRMFYQFAIIDSHPNGGWRLARRYRDRTENFRVGCVPELSRGQKVLVQSVKECCPDGPTSLCCQLFAFQPCARHGGCRPPREALPQSITLTTCRMV